MINLEVVGQGATTKIYRDGGSMEVLFWKPDWMNCLPQIELDDYLHSPMQRAHGRI